MRRYYILPVLFLIVFFSSNFVTAAEDGDACDLKALESFFRQMAVLDAIDAKMSGLTHSGALKLLNNIRKEVASMEFVGDKKGVGTFGFINIKQGDNALDYNVVFPDKLEKYFDIVEGRASLVPAPKGVIRSFLEGVGRGLGRAPASDKQLPGTNPSLGRPSRTFLPKPGPRALPVP